MPDIWADLRAQMSGTRRHAVYLVAALALFAQILLPAAHLAMPVSTQDVPREVLALRAALGQDVPLCLDVSNDASGRPDQAPTPAHHQGDCPFCNSISHLAGTIPPANSFVPRPHVAVAIAVLRPFYDLHSPAPIQRAARSRAPPILI